MEDNRNVDNLEETSYVELDEAFASADNSPEKEGPNEENALPEKYRGKSAEEIAEMHRNLESTLGRQSNELGELRRSHEQMIQYMNQLQNQSSAKPTETEENDEELWYGNPKAAVEKLVNQRLQKLESTIERERKEKALSYIQQKHPEAETMVSSQQFQDFIGESPYRKQILQQVRQNADASGLDYLLTEFKTHSKTVKKNSENNVHKAIGETGSAADSKSNSKQKIRRSDIQRLRANDPNKYEKYQSFIREAYRENRVIDDIGR